MFSKPNEARIYKYIYTNGLDSIKEPIHHYPAISLTVFPQAMTFITWRYIKKDHFQGLTKSPQLGHVSYIKWPANSTKTDYQQSLLAKWTNRGF